MPQLFQGKVWKIKINSRSDCILEPFGRIKYLPGLDVAPAVSFKGRRNFVRKSNTFSRLFPCLEYIVLDLIHLSTIHTS